MSLEPWVGGGRRGAGAETAACPPTTPPRASPDTCFRPRAWACEDPSLAEICPQPWAGSPLPSAPAQLTCEKQQLSARTPVAHTPAQAGGPRGPCPRVFTLCCLPRRPPPALASAGPSHLGGRGTPRASRRGRDIVSFEVTPRGCFEIPALQPDEAGVRGHKKFLAPGCSPRTCRQLVEQPLLSLSFPHLGMGSMLTVSP